jgi:hypothetical protein
MPWPMADLCNKAADNYQNSYSEDLEISGLQRVAQECGIRLTIERRNGEYVVVRSLSSPPTCAAP